MCRSDATDSHNELDQLGQALNTTVGQMRSLLSDITTAAGQVGESAARLDTRSEELVRRAGTQAQAAAAMAASVEQLSVSIRQVADHAHTASTQCRGAAQLPDRAQCGHRQC